VTDLPIPVGFRAETLQQIVRLLRSGESCALVGVGSSGKSNIARHLTRADVRQEYFEAEADSTLVVYLNCKPFARRDLPEFYLHALDQLCHALDGHASSLAAQQPPLTALWQAAQADPAVLAYRNLDEGLGCLIRAGAQHIILVLDDCDDLLAHAPPAFFSDLRGLRDNYKVRLVYLTLTRREPAFLREDTPEFEEFFELISAPGHTLPVAPYVESDALLMLRRLAARQVPPRALPELEARRLCELSGGHAGLLRSLFFATHYSSALAAASVSSDDWPQLAEHADVEGECRKIWDSLEPEEQADLRQIVMGGAPTPDGLRRLERRGLVRLRLNRAAEVFSPIFQRCLLAILGLNAAPAPAAPGVVVEFLDGSRQVRVNGQLFTNLIAPEVELLRCLARSAPAACPLPALVDAMRLAEQVERPESARGDPLRRLEDYVRSLKAKLGPHGQHIQPEGQGFVLS
jgi:hypothetical protein